jgi:hypothetical protein
VITPLVAIFCAFIRFTGLRESCLPAPQRAITAGSQLQQPTSRWLNQATGKRPGAVRLTV